MGTLAEQVMSGAQSAQTQQGNTVGDALQAFHITATAEHAKQELEMEQQKQDMNKATWVSSQLQAGSKLPPSSQKIWAQGFGDQLGKLYPGAHPDVLQAIKSDSDFVKGLATTIAPGLNENPSITKDVFGSDLATLQEHVTSRQQQAAMISAAQLKSEGMNGRVQVGQDNAVQAAVKHVHDDPIIKTLVGQDQSLQKARGILAGTSEHTPSWIELDESMQDAAKVLNGGTVSSDMKLKQLQQGMFDKDTGHVRGYLNSDPNQPASPAAIQFAKHFVDRLSGQIDGQLAQSATRRAAGMGAQYFHNPNIAAATTDAIKSYQNGSWRGDQLINQPAQSGPAVGTEHDFSGKTYVFQGGDVNDQKNWKVK